MGLRFGFGFCHAETTLTFLVFLLLFFSTHYSSHDISRPHIISIPIPSSLYTFFLVLAATGSFYLHSPLNFLCSFISFLPGHLCPAKLSLHTMFYFFMYSRKPLGALSIL